MCILIQKYDPTKNEFVLGKDYITNGTYAEAEIMVEKLNQKLTKTANRKGYRFQITTINY